MCGRYVQVSKIEEIQQELNAIVKLPEKYIPNPNTSAGDSSFALFRGNTLYPVEFGFSPSWSKKRTYVINARFEGDRNKDNSNSYKGYPAIYDKPFFRNAIRRNRCVIPMNGFIEGPTKEGLKKPYFVFNPTEKFIYAAGVYSVLKDVAGEDLITMAVLTKGPSPICDIIGHHRSPLILDKELINNYLDANISQVELSKLLHSHCDEQLNAYPIDSNIRNPKNKGVSVLTPVGDLIVKQPDFKVEHF